MGATAFQNAETTLTNPRAQQTGQIIALNRDTCTIDIEGLQDITAGDRITINSGRARTQLSHRSHRTTQCPHPPPNPRRHLHPGTRKSHRH